MELSEVLRNRRSVRKFKDTEISDVGYSRVK